MKKRAGFRLPVVLLVGCLAIAAAARASNLLPSNLLTNPNFDGTLDPWTSFPGYTTFDADHSATSDGTGSALVELPNTAGTGFFEVLNQCVGVVPGTQYGFGGTIRIASASETGGDARVYLLWFAGPNCSDFPTSQVTTGQVALPPGPTDVWTTLQGVGTAPGGATHAAVSVLVENTGPAPTAAPRIRPEAAALNFTLNIDDMVLVPITSTSTVPTLGAAGLAVLVVSLAGVAIFLMRR